MTLKVRQVTVVPEVRAVFVYLREPLPARPRDTIKVLDVAPVY